MLKRVVVCVFGDWKQGKTHFALTFPEPIYFFDFNIGREGVQERFNGKQILPYVYNVLPFSSPAEINVGLARFKQEYRAAINDIPEGGTIVIDTATELDDIVQTVTLHEWAESHPRSQGKQLPSLAYGVRNQTMASVLSAPLHRPGVNAVYVHKAKKEYEDDKPTGRLELAGWQGAPGESQVTLQAIKQGAEFRGRILYCRPNPALEGLPLEELSYDYLSALLG